jgi:hypothetical protein
MEKTGSVSADTRSLLERMYKHIDKQDNAKTASAVALKDQAGEIAQKMAGITMLSGQPLIDGYEMVKEAQTMMSDHDGSLELLGMVLDAVKNDRAKQAGLEPGRAYGSSTQGQELTPLEQIRVDHGLTPQEQK